MESIGLKEKIRSVYERRGVPLLGALVIGLFILERKYRLRKRKEPGIKRVLINSQLAGTAAVGLRFVLIPALVYAATKSEKVNIRIFDLLPINRGIKIVLGFLFLDYGNYLWHRLSHHSSLIWRFHQVHHSDLDLDLSTAFRFHIGEVLPSVVFRSGVVLISGLSWRWVLIYEILFEAANNFHHSNLRLPKNFEEILSKIVVTPRMHGIHHSVVLEETDSNFSVVFSFWDKIHDTFKMEILQDEINIGIPAYRSIDELGFKSLFLMPFRKTRSWSLPDGTIPQRSKSSLAMDGI